MLELIRGSFGIELGVWRKFFRFIILGADEHKNVDFDGLRILL
jgi:hypothetical protein